jgi:uncharacterized protein (TIGR02996 family)
MSQELLAEIWRRPDDRELLAVYADWLATHGEPTRAEYMQLSLLERRTPAQEKRRVALRNKHRGQWLGAARQFVWTWEESEDSPGFLSRAQCNMVKITKGFESVRALGPRLVVSVTEPKNKREARAFAELPLGTLYGLALYEADAQWITDELLTTIAPRLGGLRALVLHANEMRASDRGWGAMLAHFDALERLELTMGENPEAWLEALLKSRLVKTLRFLSVPAWIDGQLRDKLAKTLKSCELELRRERRMRYDRALGYYVS